MAEPITIQKLIGASMDSDSLEVLVNGNENAQVTTRLGETYPSAKKAIRMLFENGGLPATPHEYLNDLLLVTAEEGDYAVVTNDPSESGYYRYTNGNWELQVLNNEKSLRTFLTGYLSKLGAVLSFTEPDFTEMTTALPSYRIDGNSVVGGSGLRAIPVKGFKYLYHRGRIAGNAFNPKMYVIYGLNSLGEVKPIIAYDFYDPQNLLNGERVYHGFYPIPEDVIEIYVRIRPTDSNSYHAEYSPILALGDSEASLRDWAGKHFSRPTSSDFPVLNTHAFTDNTTYNSTKRLWFVKGNVIHTHVNSLTTKGRLYNTSTDERFGIPEEVENIRCDFDGFANISTFNETHNNWDPNFNPYYSITYSSAEASNDLASGVVEKGELTLKAIREVHYKNGEYKKAVRYLWHDTVGNFFLSDTRTGPRRYIFTFDSSKFLNRGISDIAMGFDKDENIVCVFRIEDLPVDYDDGQRRNPVILVKDMQYQAVEVVFGEDDLKPSAWFQSSGFEATDEFIVFCEYTRPSVQTANTWKVTYPVTERGNWKTVQNFVISDNPNGSTGTGMKHMHQTDIDPFTKIIYTSSGDSDAGSGIYASVDNGETFIDVLVGQEKYSRVINFVFTKDYIYWATDSNGVTHILYKATRNEDGLLDADNVEHILTFPLESGATYNTVYFDHLNAFLLLDRNDYSYRTKSMPIYVFDLDTQTLHVAAYVKKPNNSAGVFGFRCECVEFYPRDNETICGFSRDFRFGGYANQMDLLDNNINGNRIYNLLLRIYKTANGYKVTFDTV